MERQYYPVIVFSFSKRECESHALKMAQLEFTDNDEKKLIGQIFSNAMESLSEDDRRLPQVESILPLLKRGIGIHHGGLLPILKEVIELLFQEGFLKCLFSTETFSMGLNMPAKTVVFTNVRKFDGESFRLISSGEYIQMSGRAGRRGLDDRGIVVMMLDEQIDPADAKEMIKGQADPLNSAFHLGYNMLLNLLRVEEADPEYMMQRSFFQFQSNRAAPRMQEQLELVQREIESVSLSNPVLVAEYCQLRAQLERQRRRMRAEVNQPVYLLPFLNAGRLVRVKRSEEEDWGWGVVVSFTRRYTGGLQPLGKTRSAASGDPGKETDSAALGVVSSSSSSSSAAAPASSPSASTAARAQPAPSEGTSEQGYIVEVLLECAAPRPNAKAPRLPSAGESTEFLPVPVTLSCLESLSSIRLFVPQDLKHRSSRAATLKNLHEVLRRFPDGPPLLDPIEDLQIKGDEFLKALRAAESIEDRLLKHPVHKSPTRQADVAAFARRAQLEEKATALRTEIKNAQQDVVMLQTLKSMKRVLRRLDYSTADDVILLKGELLRKQFPGRAR
jgi:ATP-dependent RNA helicase DOB1